MLKKSKAESESRKGVRSGPKGGSLVYDYEGVRNVPKCMKMRITSQRNSIEQTNKRLHCFKVQSLFTLHQSPLTIHQKAIIMEVKL
jgi:hypothetical protein